jgi:hypothetical protein
MIAKVLGFFLRVAATGLKRVYVLIIASIYSRFINYICYSTISYTNFFGYFALTSPDDIDWAPLYFSPDNSSHFLRDWKWY